MSTLPKPNCMMDRASLLGRGLRRGRDAAHGAIRPGWGLSSGRFHGKVRRGPQAREQGTLARQA